VTAAPHGPEEAAILSDLHLLTAKPVLFVCNIRDTGDDEERAFMDAVRSHAAPDGAPVVVVNAELEAEVCELPPEERGAFLEGLGVRESGLLHVIQGGYRLLRLVTFFTANAREAHAWTAREGTPAAEAAGLIHTDFARGFIRAEIIRHEDLFRLGSVHAVREHGLLRNEGRDYLIQDGDIMEVRFHV
jgi:ribosome-binding ATPase YchF (GTP1/OBG family)